MFLLGGNTEEEKRMVTHRGRTREDERRGKVIPDGAVQVLFFRDMVRAEGLVCASCFYQLSWAVNCTVRPPSYSAALELLPDSTPACSRRN